MVGLRRRPRSGLYEPRWWASMVSGQPVGSLRRHDRYQVSLSHHSENGRL